MSNIGLFQFIDPDRVRGPEIDDITMLMKQGSLQDAYMDFKNNCAKYQPYSVLVFPGITDVKDVQNINFENYFKKLSKRKEGVQDISPTFDVERLKKVMDGIYKVEQVPITTEWNNTKLQEFINENPSGNISTAEEWNSCVQIIENLFRNSGTEYAYMRDILDAPEETGNVLENFKSHISVEENVQLQKMPGINTSMHYVGDKGSFTPFHVEDGGLSSINILKGGGPKVWFVIPYQFQAEAEASFAENLRNNEKSKAKTSKQAIRLCKDILQHKQYLITPKLLTDWNVPYSIVMQRPGDLFFIRTGAYHAVINMDKNIAEAINFGCDQWTSSYQPVPCNCTENLRTEVQQDRRVVISYKKSKKKLYKCDFGCEELFLTKAKLEKHEKIIHKTLFTCAECLAVFNEKRTLVRHIRVHSAEKVKKECEICKKKVVDLKQHKRRNHENLKECEKCKKKFYSHRLEQHKQKCMVVCPVCHITCANKGYLTQHINRKHKK